MGTQSLMTRENSRLPIPVSMGDEQRKRYARVGLDFTRRIPKGYSELQFPIELTAAALASLPYDDLHHLISPLSDTPYSSLLDEARRIQLLIHQATTVHEDGFSHPTLEKPYTWPLNEKIPEEIDGQLSKLRTLGIKGVKIGLEMEFSLPENAIEGFSHWMDVKNESLSNLSNIAELQDLQGEVVLAKKDKLEKIRDFNAREILMYDMVEIDPRTRDILEPIFGKSRDGHGYYDGQGVLELKLKPVDPITAIKNRKLVLKILYEKAVEYGLELHSIPSFHVNCSFWDADGNMFDDTHHAFSTKGKLLSQGITKAFYDNILVLLRHHEMRSPELADLWLSVARDAFLRFSLGRIEVRPSARDNLQDSDVLITMLLAGAIYGLSESGNKDEECIQAEQVLSLSLHHPPDELKVTSHLLNNAIILEDGTIRVSKDYIIDKIETIAFELGMIDTPPDNSLMYALLKRFYQPEYLPFVIEFFSKLKIQESNGEFSLEFPSTSEGIYEFTTPSVDMDKIPTDLGERLAAGDDSQELFEEMRRYLKIGDPMPQPEKKYRIDVRQLSERMTIVATHSKFVVGPYELNTIHDLNNKPDDWPLLAYVRWDRMRKSMCLRQGYSTQFFELFIALTDEVLKPEELATPTSADVNPDDIKKELFSKIRDRDWVLRNVDANLEILYEPLYNSGSQSFTRSKKAVEFVFKNITNMDIFQKGLCGLMDSLNKDFTTEYKYVVRTRNYIDETYDFYLTIDPKFFVKLRRYLRESVQE